MAAMTRPLDRSNIQSLVFQPHRCAYSRHFLFQAQDKAGAKRFLGEWLPHVTHGGVDLDNPPGPLVNITVSWTGLDTLGAFDDLGGRGEAEKVFYFDFKDPPDAASLGAYGESAPENWWNKRFESQHIHFTVHVYCTSAEMLAEASKNVRDSAGRNGVQELIPTSDGEAITGRALEPPPLGLRKLHFGYSDGFSQPDVNWDDDPAFEPQDGRRAYPRGHFIIDDFDDKLQSFPAEDPWRGLVHHGSYVALAWVRQKVADFNGFLRQNAPKVAPALPPKDAEELLAAKMMGRWRDGTPLVLSPDKAAPALAGKNFDYSQDLAGVRCPVAAHVRIVNGRDQPLDAAHSMMFPAGFPRVLRRGSSYGSWLEGEVDDGQDRGILGMFLCANVNRQFYDLMRWMAKTNFSDAYKDPNGQDPLFASRSVPRASRSFTIPGNDGKVTLKGIPDFIRIQGVAILLLPSLATLDRLSR
jgi:deferrochelatase/peroxidase EfeB